MPADVLAKIKQEISSQVGQELGVSQESVYKAIEYPPREEMGDLAIPFPALGKKPQNLEIKSKFIRSLSLSGPFLNLRLDETQLFMEVFSSMDQDYGIEKVEKPKRIVIEHTSANPIHPLHIGHLRNSIIGDALVRLSRARGHEVISRFYVNDSGRQVAILIYGLSKLGYPEPPDGAKKDLWAGTVYAMTNIILEIRAITDELKTAQDAEYREKVTKRDELVGLASEIRSRNQEYFDRLAESIRDDPDPEGKIADIIRRYEAGDPQMKEIVRKYVNHVLEGFRESLGRLNIEFDEFDYESDLLWSGEVKSVLRSALSSRARIEYKGTEALDLDKYLDDEVRKELRIPAGLEIPPLVLTRSDGTTLYTVRDIAYTIRKFLTSKAEQVINVIAEQQTVPQIQLRAALYLLGYPEMAKNLIHYSYSMVTLPGMTMSGRLGRYISLDEVYEKVKQAVEEKTKDRGNQVNIAEIVNSAIRYALLSVSADKPITFNVGKVTNFEQNSGPYLQYTYVRAYNILSKFTGEINLDVDYGDLVGEKRRLLLAIAKFPETFKNSADSLEPELLVSYLRYLADTFNAWYDKERVLQEQDEKKRMTRLNLVKGVEVVMRNGLRVLGISSLTKM
ncbi:MULTISPECIES: arginine--tRNA ligase [Metallosphaera]|uniref:Arginine--tRNA ligase n=3 Tax=Metallosphaera TaxID=41980 RepID=A4YHG8_METS5|nr:MULTISPECIES: arginine--tRNA ligase [Metallosphaera]ABP95870.1 arginyl-tRNA synthetase [Metallosphaera sedula DSM 5348]AIM27854.1 arginyl-tRNA synthetase [Metallosphaera sedula]AKV74699.1 arginyl-tRNA synthetase [Metallosphaera sedula]AKV76937.1 arginyl-tRNA synthetase [Metallosphaera sedula]AKV79188.1 arginyl-tRNA synthetase [Metallosphaera sedula]